MNKYMKNSLIGLFVYLLILVVYFGIFVNKPNEFLLTIFFGPFLWIPLLTYPVIILIAIIVFQSKRKQNISPCLISSSIIVFGFGLILTEDIFKNIQEEKHVHIYYLIVASLSCFIGFMYAKWRTPKKPN